MAGFDKRVTRVTCHLNLTCMYTSYHPSINLSFPTIFNLVITTRQTNIPHASLGKFGCGWPCLVKPNQNNNLQIFLSISLHLYQKSKTMIDFVLLAINLSLWTIFNMTITPRTIKSTLASLGMFGSGCVHLTTPSQK